MANESCATPTWSPISKDTFSKLIPSQFTAKPSEQGYNLGFPGRREVAAQEQLIKLFYARHFNVTTTEIAIAIGITPALSDNREEYKKTKEDLASIWRILRSRSFSAKSHLSQVVQHAVEQFDFMSMVAKFLQLENAFNRIPAGRETAEDRQVRVDTAGVYKRLSKNHIERMIASKAEAITVATRALDIERYGVQTTVKHVRVQEATAILETRQQEQQKWERELLALQGNFNPDAAGPFHKTYACLSLRAQQRFWARIWSKDLAVTMLAGVKNIIDIPATLEESEDLYMTLFVVYAMDTWKYCNGVDFSNKAANIALHAAGVRGGYVKMSGEAMRPQVYANMSEASRLFFEDAPGKELDRLRVSCDASETPSKRKRVEAKFIPIIDIPLIKRQRT
jgi:hypothetical protein